MSCDKYHFSIGIKKLEPFIWIERIFVDYKISCLGSSKNIKYTTKLFVIVQKICEKCGKKFTHRASDYCSSDCALND